MENDVNNRSGLEKIFQRTLMQIAYLPIWSMYLDHVRRHNNTITDSSHTARKTITAAFELALKQVGLDKESGSMWQDYISFIKKEIPGIVGGSGSDDTRKMDQLRMVYQRAICVPTTATNILWKEYDNFERGINKVTVCWIP